MRRLGVFIFGVLLSLTFAFGGSVIVVKGENKEKIVYVGGMPAGFTLKAGGAQIIGFCDIVAENSSNSPALNAGMHIGDTIKKVAGIRVETIGKLNEIVNQSKGNKVDFEVLRGKEVLNFEIKPIKDPITQRYKIGVLVRDSVSGIGTVTYVNKENGRFGALGHAVAGENREEMQISNGIVYECNIIGINKGIRGRAGELKGMFLNDKTIGNAEKLCDCGIFGQITGDFEKEKLTSAAATSEFVKPGKAYIYSTISGTCPKRYNVEIVKVDKGNKEHKNYVIKITDDDLIAQTGGIVQGMSGSPILQDGKLVGAITHVFLNDPTRGYGIDIIKMINE